jgi:hypothetical protein
MGVMNPEVDQFMPRRLQQEHDKGNHANPATEEDFNHQQANCPGCRKEAADENDYDLHEDHINGKHEDSAHSGCEFCYPHGERHNASLTTLPAPQKPSRADKVIHTINHVSASHDGSEPGCPMCERWGTNWIFPNKNI